MTKHLFTIGICLCLAGRAFALPIGDVRALYDWSDLPLLGAPPLVEITNTRGPGAGKVTDVTPGQAVLLEEKGPGCIERLSIYSIQGTLKVFVDGAAAPQIDIPLNKLYQQYPFSQPDKLAKLDTDKPQQFPFLLPLSNACPGYKNACYIPIPYAQSVKVVLEHPAANPWYSYNILLHRYPAGMKVDSYHPQALQARQAEVKAAALAWRNMGQPPMAYPNAKTTAENIAIPAGATVDLWKSTGPGTIVGLRLRAKPWHKAVDRLLVLRAYWDGETRPSVEVPIGDLCASAGTVRQAWVLPVGGGGKEGWYWCYLPMPFASARLTLENLSTHSIPWLDYEITARPGTPAPNAGRFCARWKREMKIADTGVYELLNAAGAGKLIGYNLYAGGFKVPIKNFRQSDRMALYRDGELEASIAGGALMSYFYNGYYTGPNWDTPLSAIPVMENFTFGVYADHRYFLTDAPNWEQAARLVMEIKMDADTGRDFTSTVYWYRALGGSNKIAPLMKDDLLMPMHRAPGVLEAEDLVKTADFDRGDVLVISDPDQRYAVSNNKYITFAPMGFGDSITFRVPVATAGTYEISARLLCGPSGGFWGFTANNAPISSDAKTYLCMGEEAQVNPYNDGWQNLGKYDLVAGENYLTFVSHSPWIGTQLRGMLLTLDAFLLKPAVVK
ncbi:MAG: DUF2961 domain-containing protein [Armatimonadota bacterium]